MESEGLIEAINFYDASAIKEWGKNNPFLIRRNFVFEHIFVNNKPKLGFQIYLKIPNLLGSILEDYDKSLRTLSLGANSLFADIEKNNKFVRVHKSRVLISKTEIDKLFRTHPAFKSFPMNKALYDQLITNSKVNKSSKSRKNMSKSTLCSFLELANINVGKNVYFVTKTIEVPNADVIERMLNVSKNRKLCHTSMQDFADKYLNNLDANNMTFFDREYDLFVSEFRTFIKKHQFDILLANAEYEKKKLARLARINLRAINQKSTKPN